MHASLAYLDVDWIGRQHLFQLLIMGPPVSRHPKIRPSELSNSAVAQTW